MVLDKAVKILERGYVCDHCLGRQFAQLLTGIENYERGRILREAVAFELETEEKDVDDVNFQSIDFRSYECEEKETGKCIVCHDLFDSLDGWMEKILRKLQGYEFDNFLVGCKPSDEMVKREEEIWEEIGIKHCEPIKSEINRLIGKKIEEKTSKKVEFEMPEIVILLNFETEEVELDVNSLCIYGEYNKKVRGIPQTVWPSGKYEISVQELIDPAFLRAADATEDKFHGAGREDIDAKCLGWRPFILEILEPKRRDLDLEKVREQINRQEEVKVRNLKIVDRDKVEELKSWRPDKSYRALVKLGEAVDEEELKKIEQLETTLEQRTPSRVAHRRSDRTRKRKVKRIDWKRVDEKAVEIEVKAEAGTYIKEMISGDEGRTEPSLAGLLDVEAECEELDVIEIHDRDKMDI
ncbi:MAG: tRNA pseudouridine(54/55) synthase Pus10 [Candidatus Aenigmatarchaeota archaeon]